MKRYRVDLQYRGTGYIGWQTQLNGLAIQDKVEKALEIALRVPTKTLAASRTDAGVHALQQVFTFASESELMPERLKKNLNGLLPHDIRISSLAETSLNFHPIADCLGKCYVYSIFHRGFENPLFSDYALSIPYELDIEAMRACANVFVGEHDFTAFCAQDSSAKSKVRTLFDINVQDCGELVRIWYIGNGFLKQMVRALTGLLIEAGRHRIDRKSAEAILASKQRTQTVKTALAQGLTLYRIFYDKIPSTNEFIAQNRSFF